MTWCCYSIMATSWCLLTLAHGRWWNAYGECWNCMVYLLVLALALMMNSCISMTMVLWCNLMNLCPTLVKLVWVTYTTFVFQSCLFDVVLTRNELKPNWSLKIEPWYITLVFSTWLEWIQINYTMSIRCKWNMLYHVGDENETMLSLESKIHIIDQYACFFFFKINLDLGKINLDSILEYL